MSFYELEPKDLKKKVEMGMYTELHYNVNLKENIPSSLVDTLNIMVYGGAKQVQRTDHRLFTKNRAMSMFRCDSYYFAGDTSSTLRFDMIKQNFVLNVKCNLKNYEEEIEAFINWIDPYVDAKEGDFLGFYRYEESQNPTLIFKEG